MDEFSHASCNIWCMCACSVMSNSVTPWTVAHQAPLSIEFSNQEYWNVFPFLLQGIFLTQGSNSGLLHCRRILYQPSHKERVLLYTVVFNMPYYNVYWPPQKWNIDHLNSFSILTYTCLPFSSLHLPFALLWHVSYMNYIYYSFLRLIISIIISIAHLVYGLLDFS